MVDPDYGRSHVSPPLPKGSRPTGIPPDIRVFRDVCYDTFTGTAESLIAAGILTAAQIPGVPGLPKSMATFYRGERVVRGANGPRDEHYMQVRRGGRRLVVYVGLSKQESTRRRSIRDAEWEREEEKENALRAHEQELEDRAFYSNPDNLRDQVRLCLRMLTNVIEDHISDDGQPRFLCRLSPDGSEQMHEALRKLWDWHERVEVIPIDPLAQKVCAARLDKAFQSFMETQCMGERP